MTPAIRLRGPADIISVLPYHLGYRPVDSVVLVCMEGNRLSFVGRVDVPPPGVDPWLAVDAVVPQVVREGPDGVFIVGFQSGNDGVARLSELMRDALLDEDIRVGGRLHVRGGRWWSLDCTGDCCPAEGEVLPEDGDVPAIADYVLLGRRPVDRRADLAERLEPAPDDTSSDRFTRLVADHEQAARRGGSVLRGYRRKALDAWGELLDLSDEVFLATRISEESWARMAVSVRDVHLRDLVIAWLCPGTLELDVLDPQLVALARTRLPPRGAPPRATDDEWARQHDRTTERLAQLCRHTPVTLAPGPLTILANFTWWLGDGALTRIALDRALSVDPDYRLAQLTERMVDFAIRPGRLAEARRGAAAPPRPVPRESPSSVHHLDADVPGGGHASL